MLNAPILRQHCPASVLAWISTKRCWHLDVWLYSDSTQGALYCTVQTSVAGKYDIRTMYFALLPDAFGLYGLYPIDALPDDIRETHLNAPAILRSTTPLVRRHMWHRVLRPLVSLWPRGDFPRRSVAFHCVKPVGVVDPMEGIANLYDTTGRAVRDATQGARVRAALHKAGTSDVALQREILGNLKRT